MTEAPHSPAEPLPQSITHRQKDMETDRLRKTGRQAETDKQTDRQAETHRQTDSCHVWDANRTIEQVLV